ncbi:MAG: hypothetical protein ABIP56_03110 [Dokdonella sp.]
MNRLTRQLQVGALALVCGLGVSAAHAADAPVYHAMNRGVSPVVHADISPALRDMTPLPVPDLRFTPLREMDDDRESDLMQPFGFQDYDMSTDTTIYPPRIPAPTVSFNGQPNISGVAPPDSVGDVGPNHYVAMSNLSFQIFNKTGTSVFGPALTNTLWAGFGGQCEAQNAGDPVVLHDQLANRWLLMQFTSASPTWYICLALSTGPDPTGTYQRYQISTGGNFPDYPKMGVWSDGYYVSTREFLGSGGPFQGVGAYAMNRTQMLAGNLAPTVISMLATPTPAFNTGDGLLPADLDGFTLPPSGSPEYFVGSMDDGGPYGATQDALTLWKFTANFTTPANSTFLLANTIPIAAYDTIYPCVSGRNCIPQSGTTNGLDIQSYRQRPLHRLAYRNFGGHQSLVTNQSVEAPGPFAGVRWWEIRSPNVMPVIYQQGTYAPADGLHRWMGSAAQDSAGNMAMGFSTSSATTFPSLAYTGRLAGDPLGTMPQGEGIIHTGTGSQTGGGNRWGDYSSLNVDPTDDCTFWFVSEYLPTTSASGWQLRIGSFRFNECGTPGFSLGVTPAIRNICVGANASYTVNNSSIAMFAGPVTLALTGAPAPSTNSFSPNPIPTPGTSTLTITNTAGIASGTYPLTINGTATGADPRSTNATLVVTAAIAGAPTLTSPGNSTLGVSLRPAFQWSNTGATDYTLQVASDAAFTNIVFTTTGVPTTATPASDLASDTVYYWRVRSNNACGTSAFSTVFSFRTLTAPGTCSAGTAPINPYSYGFESGANGWTSSGTGNTWALSAAQPHSGTMSFFAADPATVSDQRLVSPPIILPTGQLPLTLQFWHRRAMENSGSTACFDGGLLEISTDAGMTFTQIPTANLLTDPYTGAISSSFSNPLAGLQAWCSAAVVPYLNSIVDISAYQGQTAQFRFRLGSDTSASREGWYIDDVKVQSCGGDLIFKNGFDSVP